MAFLISPFLFLSHLLLLSTPAAANITLSSSLVAGGGGRFSWRSPAGEFAFGFHSLSNTTLFLLAIWFDKIPDKTVVWTANGGDPAPAGSKVNLTGDGLFLSDPAGRIIWKREPSGSITVAYGAMLDTGNYVLTGSDSTLVWESFKEPTDTILPTQVLNPDGALFSRLSETNYAKGRFKLHFSNGDLNLNPIAWPGEFIYNPYFRSGTSNANSSESGNQLVFDESAKIYILKMNNGSVPLSWKEITPDTQNNYYRATLDFNGVFAQYAYPRAASGAQTWSIDRYVPDNMCTAIFNEIGSGACGFNSYCSVENGRPSCSCPVGYSLIDPGNEFGGCKPDYPQGCGMDDDGLGNGEEIYELRRIQGLNWPLGDYERLEPYNQTQCESFCLNDCLCAVAIFGGTTCWKKKLPLSNGRMEGGESWALIKVRKGAPPPSGFSDHCVPGTKKSQKMAPLYGSLGVSLSLNVLLLVAACLVLLSRGNRRLKRANHESIGCETNLHLFTYRELKEATDGFKIELGSGSFGTVYKGVLKSALSNVVAVKKLDRLTPDGEKEFRTEVSAIGRIHHRNVIRLLGFCEDGPSRFLVYEYMSNGTLADLLFGIPKPDWNKRVSIALGIARGLLYVHEECGAPIIHCDIKPQNILLDDDFRPKISDFGLAKLLIVNQSRFLTGIRGTRGYVAPEWFNNKDVTVKVDVYSFGVVLLEIICCRRSVATEFEEEKRAILTEWVHDCYREGKLDLLVAEDETAMADIVRLKNWVMTAMWCIQDDPSNRPTMKTVIQMLEGVVSVRTM